MDSKEKPQITNDELAAMMQRSFSEMTDRLLRIETAQRQHGDILGRHSEILEQHGERLDSISEQLSSVERKLDRDIERNDTNEVRIENLETKVFGATQV